MAKPKLRNRELNVGDIIEIPDFFVGEIIELTCPNYSGNFVATVKQTWVRDPAEFYNFCHKKQSERKELLLTGPHKGHFQTTISFLRELGFKHKLPDNGNFSKVIKVGQEVRVHDYFEGKVIKVLDYLAFVRVTRPLSKEFKSMWVEGLDQVECFSSEEVQNNFIKIIKQV